MSDKTTKPLHNNISVVLGDESQHAIIVGFRVEPSPDGRGIIIKPPAGQRIDIPGLRGDEVGKRLEVRVK